MNKNRIKLIHEGEYAAEVNIAIDDTNDGWAPYLSLEDACKLDDVRDALRADNLQKAQQMARIFRLTPVEI